MIIGSADRIGQSNGDSVFDLLCEACRHSSGKGRSGSLSSVFFIARSLPDLGCRVRGLM